MKKSATKRAKYSILRSILLVIAVLMFTAIPLACRKGNEPGGAPELGPIPEGGARVTFHYFRDDQNYNGWNMWLWAKGTGEMESDRNDFTSDTEIGGKTWKSLTATSKAAIAPDEDGNLVGFIVRLNDWEDKDVEADRFVPADKFTDGVATVYLVTGDPTLYYSEEEAIVAMNEAMKKKITAASFVNMSRVYFETSAPITEKSFFKLKDDEGNVLASLDCSKDKEWINETVAAFSFAEGVKFDVKKNYTIYDEPAEIDEKVNFNKRAVSKFNAFGSKEFTDAYAYDGALGAEYSTEQTKFTVWSPYAVKMTLNVYDEGTGGTATTYVMNAAEKGTWTYTLAGDQKNKYYTYTIENGDYKREVVDPYARSAGRDGKRGMIVDLESTNPTGWAEQQMPTLESNSRAVIYEAQLRDLTIHESSGVSAANRGKFLGLTETGTVNSKGQSTALDYLKDLGVTEVHFQPLFDFASVNENFNQATYNKDGEYNWGYDPLNYNVPEGSYSTNPADGNVRVREMKEMIMALHNAGIQVIMDVVYNHVANAQTSNFDALMPEYYFRMTDQGTLYNGSGCGNETASDHAMFGKFMIDSVKYWTEEYKIDGFRFDLMGLHDIKTMNDLYDELAAINPDVIVYGEGWTGGDSGLKSSEQAVIANAKKMPNIAFFNDVIRDGLKGSVFTMSDTGFVSGKANTDSAVYVGAKGATANFAVNPTQNINYVACHDNSLLWDKLNASVKGDADTLKSMNRLAAVSVLTSQGASFFPAGEEMLRSKPTTKDNPYDNRPTASLNDPDYYFADNSYRSPDSVNAVNWELLDTNSDMVSFYKELIKIKKTFAQFGITTKEQIDSLVVVKDTNLKDGVAVYAVKAPDSNEYAVIVLNNNSAKKTVAVPQGAYSVFVEGDDANATTALRTFTGAEVEVGALSAVIMTATLEQAAVTAWTYSIA